MSLIIFTWDEYIISLFFLFFGLIERRKSVEITQVKPTHPNRCLQAFNAALWAPNSSWRKELSLENVDMVRAVDFKPTCTCSWLIYKRARDKIWEESTLTVFRLKLWVYILCHPALLFCENWRNRATLLPQLKKKNTGALLVKLLERRVIVRNSNNIH